MMARRPTSLLLEAVAASDALAAEDEGPRTRDTELITARRPPSLLLEAVAAHDALAAEDEGHRVDDGA